MICRTSLCTAEKGMHLYNTHVEQVGVRLEKVCIYVCHVAQVETTLQLCFVDVWWIVCVCVCVGGGG